MTDWSNGILNSVQLLHNQNGQLAPAREVMVGSGRGGTGKTSVCGSCASALATNFGRHVVVCDCDYQASLTRLLGARAARDPLSDPPVQVHGMTLFAAGAALKAASATQIAAHIERAAQTAAGGVLMLDLRPDALDQWHAIALARTRMTALLVPDLRPAAVPELVKLVGMVRAAGRDFRIVGNLDTNKKTARRAKDFLRTAFPDSLMTCAWLPNGKQADEAFEQGRPSTVVDPTCALAQGCLEIAGELVALEAA